MGFVPVNVLFPPLNFLRVTREQFFPNWRGQNACREINRRVVV